MTMKTTSTWLAGNIRVLTKRNRYLSLIHISAISMLEGLLKSLACYLNEHPYACSKDIEMKCQELLYILTCYYPLHQIITVFYPISTYTESFQDCVRQNYDKVKNVEEFAHLGGYTTTTFRRLFKNMYGVPVYGTSFFWSAMPLYFQVFKSSEV